MPKTTMTVTPDHKVQETKVVKVMSHLRKQRLVKNTKKEYMIKHDLSPEAYYFQLAELLNEHPVDYIIERLGWYHLDRQRNKLYHQQYLKAFAIEDEETKKMTYPVRRVKLRR